MRCLILLLLTFSFGGDCMPLMPRTNALLAAARAAEPRRPVMPRPDYRVVYDSDVGGGYSDTETKTIHLVPGADRTALGHEAGHMADAEYLSDGDRRYFARLLHAPKGPWIDDRTGEGHPEGNAAEWFADYFSAAVNNFKPTHRRRGTIVTNDVASYANIGPKRLAAFEAAMDRLRRRRGLDAWHW